jgi:hypothetical protein
LRAPSIHEESSQNCPGGQSGCSSGIARWLAVNAHFRWVVAPNETPSTEHSLLLAASQVVWTNLLCHDKVIRLSFVSRLVGACFRIGTMPSKMTCRPAPPPFINQCFGTANCRTTSALSTIAAQHHDACRLAYFSCITVKASFQEKLDIGLQVYCCG